MKIICTLNLKGGCAKTTTAVSMAELLANGFKSKNGKIEPGKVLLFDNDKQGNASRLFDAYQNETEAQAAAVLRNATFKGNTIRHTKNKNLDIVPCNYFMELAELEIKADTDTPQHDRYRRAFEELKATPPFGNYDYCIIPLSIFTRASRVISTSNNCNSRTKAVCPIWRVFLIFLMLRPMTFPASSFILTCNIFSSFWTNISPFSLF